MERIIVRRDKDGKKIVDVIDKLESIPTDEIAAIKNSKVVAVKMKYNLDDIDQALKVIINRRKELGKDQSELGLVLGLTQSGYSFIESGKNNMTAKQFISICRVLNIEINLSC